MGALTFQHYSPQEGYPDLAACQEKAQEYAHRILPNIRKNRDLTYRDRAADAVRKTQALKKIVSNIFINRARYQQNDHAFRPLYAIWTMLNACNFRCDYCDNHQGEHYFDLPDPGRISTKDGKRLLDVIFTGTPAIYWCGGEPTLRKDLPELVDHAWHRGFFPNMINTNGSLLHLKLQKPEWRDFLWQMDVLILSLDGLNLKDLGTMWGIKNPEQVLINLLLLRELKQHIDFKLSVNTVITPDNIDQAQSVLDLAWDLDVWFVPVPVNFKHRPSQELLQNPRYLQLAEKILKRKSMGQKIIGSTTLLKRLLFAEPYRCYTALKPHIWPDGSVCWPCRASANVKPVNINLLDYSHFDKAYQAGRRAVNPDNFHGTAANQCGGDCAWMQNYTTARYMEGITHPVGSGFLSEFIEFAFR